jgi:sec-independent protein translocase protein TatC
VLQTADVEIDDPEQPLVEHLEELRFRLIRSIVAVAVGTGLVWTRAGQFLSWLAKPVGGLIFIAPTEAFFVRLKVAMFGGFLLALPFVLYQVWAFVARALGRGLRASVVRLIPASYLLFLLGAGVCVGLVIPAAMTFLISYGGEDVKPMLSVGSYAEFVISLAIAFGVVFQLPLILILLNRIGMVSRRALTETRRYAWLIAFIIAAVLTPGPDVISQISLGVPMVLLFELSLLFMR